MKVVIICLLAICLSSLTITRHNYAKALNSNTNANTNEQSVDNQLYDHIVGGFTGRKIDSLKDLDEEEKRVNDFIISSIPSMAKWKLVSVREQVVAGMNYCLTYQSNVDVSQTVEYCVWSKVWENNFLQF